MSVIIKLDILPLMCAADKVWITELTLIHKNIRSFVTHMRKSISQSDVKLIMMSPIKTIMSVLKASTDIITNIPSRSIGLAEMLPIMSVSTFKIAVILYLSETELGLLVI